MADHAVAMRVAKMQVLLTSPERVLFDGAAEQVTAPGEQGTLEVLPFHRPLLTRLLRGTITVDRKSYLIRRGVLQVVQDRITIVVEAPEPR